MHPLGRPIGQEVLDQVRAARAAMETEMETPVLHPAAEERVKTMLLRTLSAVKARMAR